MKPDGLFTQEFPYIALNYMPYRIALFKAFQCIEGESLSPTAWLKVTQEMINHFAKATHDFQWIHVDAERAKEESPLKKP